MLNIFRPLFQMQERNPCEISQDNIYNGVECGRLMLEAGTDVAIGTYMNMSNFELILAYEPAASQRNHRMLFDISV
jgi:hypothetical protein